MNVMTSTITNHFLLSIIATLLLSHLPPGRAYTILGGLPPEPTDENDTNNQTQESNPNNNAKTITTTLRHFQNRQIHLQTQSREKHTGRLSMAGTLWEAGPVLADYVTNPGCPLHSFRRMRVHADSDGNVVLPAHPPTTVVELGSGVGFASLAAAFLGCRVLGTDGALSSVELLKENFGRYDGEFGEGAKPKGLLLEWGDSEAVRELIERELEGCFPDVVMASDVVYAHSAREELDKTIRELCPEGHLDGIVVVAHRWRVDPKGEEAFFRGFEDEFEVEEVPVELLPPDPYYRTRSLIDFKLPVSIFEMRRKW